MSKLLEGRRLIFLDFEVMSDSIAPETGKPYWSVIFIDYQTNKGTLIKNDVEKLKQYYEENKENIFVTYNGRGYDQWIFKGIMLGYCPAFITKQIIEKGIHGAMVVRGAKDIQMYHFDASNKFNSLKQLEAFMGSEIQESSVPFNLARPMTQEEELELLKYNVHDVRELIKVFNASKKTFNATIGLLEMFNQDLSLINKTSSQITATILGAEKLEYHDNEYDFIYPETLRIGKYQYIKDWFDKIKNGELNGDDGKLSVEFTVGGIPTVYALGGVHGAVPNYSAKGRIFSIDVGSLYPSLIIEYGLMSRAVDSVELFKNIKKTRMEYKKAKNPLQEALKLVLNLLGSSIKNSLNVTNGVELA